MCPAIAIFILGCSGTSPRIDPGNGYRNRTDNDFVASIRQQVDDQVTYRDAMADIEKVRGKMVRWSGDIVKMWDDRLLIAIGAGGGHWNHFVLLIDWPLPELSTVENLTQTVSLKDAIWALGRIIDLRTIVLETGSDLTIPHLECYAISKDNDRQFANPVWVGNKM